MAKTKTYLLVLVAAIALVSGKTTTLRRRNHNSPLAEGAEENSVVEYVPSDRRQLWSWFSLLFMLGPHNLCEHDRPTHGPLQDKWDRDCTGDTSTTSTTTSSSSETTYYDAETETYVTSNEAAEDSEQSSGTNANQGAIIDSGNWWPLAVAGLAASVAMAAVIVGQRRGAVNPHPMQGSVARRRGLFGNFADRALCDPGVEMANSKDDYRLA